MRRFTFVVCAFLPAIRDGYGARGSDPDGRAAETSRPDRGTNKRGRSTTIPRRRIDRLVVEGKLCPPTTTIPLRA